MYLSRLVVTLLTAGTLSAPLAAQGIPRGARTSSQPVANAPRLMVANPFAFAPGDSANAVRIGSAMRQEMKDIAGRNFTVVEQTQMNDALKQYGYPIDAILTPPLATTLAKNIQARVLVTGTLAKGEGGRTSVTARLIGVNDDAGNVVTLTQGQGQSPEDFGKKIAQALAPAVKSLPDAKACVDQQTSKPEKAAEAANKATKALANNGLAEFCLAQIAKAQKKPADVVKHLQAAVKGDPLSLPAWTALAEHYQAANDTANTLVAFKQMLRVAPTNQKLREELFKYFLQSGHPETAREVADEGLKLDPYNADLYDLKSNACLFLSDFKCAVDALETMYATDSTKADTLFFTKISAAAAEGDNPDKVRLLKWSQIGSQEVSQQSHAVGLSEQGLFPVRSGGQRHFGDQPHHCQGHHFERRGPALEAAKALIAATGSSVCDHQERLDRGRNEARLHCSRGRQESIPWHSRRGPRKQCRSSNLPSSMGTLRPRKSGRSALQRGRAPAAAAAGPAGCRAAAPDVGEGRRPVGQVYPAANYLLGLATLFSGTPDRSAGRRRTSPVTWPSRNRRLLAASDSALTAGRSVNPRQSTRIWASSRSTILASRR